MRAFDRDLIRGRHYGQRPCEPHSTGRTHGCTDQRCDVLEALANPEPSTHGPNCPMSTTAIPAPSTSPTSTATRCFLDDDKRSNPPSPRAKRGRHEHRETPPHFPMLTFSSALLGVAADCVHDAFTPVHQSTLLEPAFC